MDELFLTFVNLLANRSGAVIRPYFNNNPKVETKPDKTPVTQADREAEEAMRAMIALNFPEHAILGEEVGATKTDSPYTWVLDPIDGTKAFIAGGTEWGTLIALCEDGIPILGILDQPVTGERWIGVRGRPTIYNDRPICTRLCATLKQAEFSTTSTGYFTPEQAARVIKLSKSCGTVVKDGDCYAYGLLARGLRDIVVDAGLKPYDILALVPIIEGAGGKITGWDGSPITLSSYDTALAAGDPALTLDRF